MVFNEKQESIKSFMFLYKIKAISLNHVTRYLLFNMKGTWKFLMKSRKNQEARFLWPGSFTKYRSNNAIEVYLTWVNISEGST